MITGAIVVTVNNPPPSGSQPAVTGNQLFVRVQDGSPRDDHRPTGGDGIRIVADVPVNGVVTDWAVASTVVYEYRVLAQGANGTATWSAWPGFEDPGPGTGVHTYGDGLYGDRTYGSV